MEVGGGSSDPSSSRRPSRRIVTSRDGVITGVLRVHGSAPENRVPVIGATAIKGGRQHMEDALSIWTNLCSPPVTDFRPIHFLGVFDGHSGAHYAVECKNRMHTILEEELPRADSDVAATAVQPPQLPPPITTDERVLQEYWRCIMTRSFLRTEVAAMRASDSSHIHAGTTAVVVVLTDSHIVVANCGDSRAVLHRRGHTIVPLSFDHKPNRADEMHRIESQGGRVVYSDVPRVEGTLAMSRAIGDMLLKPFVIAEPEVTFTLRDEADEFIIIATDGLWDVMTSKMACRIVRRCLRTPPATPTDHQTRQSRSTSAAMMLTRMALARNSVDNISVVVVDLKRFDSTCNYNNANV